MNKIIKLVLLGMGGVGKSSLVINWVTGKFFEDYDPTIEESYRKQCSFDSDSYVLEIFDIAGQSDFESVRSQYMRIGDAFISIYAINDIPSFREAVQYYDEVYMVKEKNAPFVLVGNKCDKEDERVVTYETGLDVAGKKNWPFLETSAKTGVNVANVFETAAREVIKSTDGDNVEDTVENVDVVKSRKKLKRKNTNKKCNLL